MRQMEPQSSYPGNPSAVHEAEGERRVGFDMETMVGYLLAGGVILSMSFIAAGLLWNRIRTGSFALTYNIQGMNFFQFVLNDVRTVVDTGFGPPHRLRQKSMKSNRPVSMLGIRPGDSVRPENSQR